MSSVPGRRFIRLGFLVAAMLAFPASTVAVMDRGTCQATGTATSGGADLTTDTEWHMQSTDVAGGSGTASAKQTSAQVGAYALGLSLPIASGSGDGDTAGAVGGINVAPYAVLGARFTVSGSSVGEDGGCAGHITIILDDVNPLLTVLGGGGIVLALIGLLAIVLGARSSGGMGARILAAIFGGLGGAGLGVALEQFGILDPTSFVGLGIAIVGLLLGFILAGRMASGTPRPA